MNASSAQAMRACREAALRKTRYSRWAKAVLSVGVAILVVATVAAAGFGALWLAVRIVSMAWHSGV